MNRRAAPSDVPAIAALAVEAVSRVNDASLEVDMQGVTRLATVLCSRPAHFCWVSEVDGQVVGALAAEVNDGFWFKGKQANVVMFYCKVPLDGGRLIKKFASWLRPRTAIKLAVFSLEWDADPKIARFLARLGFDRNYPQQTWVR